MSKQRSRLSYGVEGRKVVMGKNGGVDPSRVVAEQFNEAINARALDDLASLMTSDHRFIDAAGTSTGGKLACVHAWRTFFDAFPDYQNVFHEITSLGNVVIVRGRSSCSTAALDGPALWSARIDHGAVSEWCVYDDTPENRELLGI